MGGCAGVVTAVLGTKAAEREKRERGRCGEDDDDVMLGRTWFRDDDGSGYDIVGMVVMRCDEDGGGGMMKVAAGCGVRRRVEARGE
ncbi:hypothetical protein Tco_0624017 [Tanacetum coccineum]|uniref:Uncharacterized protein n=1 Tax=Tanacetum coccineum TaxID=301880 RepID=A0ABQ4WCP7_9ASTR